MTNHLRTVKHLWPAICLGALIMLPGCTTTSGGSSSPQGTASQGTAVAPRSGGGAMPANLTAAAGPAAAQASGLPPAALTNVAKRRALLTQLLEILPTNPHWNHWLQSTGELPPDYDALPTQAELPDPLTIEENGQSVAIMTPTQWARKRQEIRSQLQYWVTGAMPPAPGNVQAQILTKKLDVDGQTTVEDIVLTFGPNHQGKLNLQLRIPAGKGPFPVFISTYGMRSWAQIAVRRGYIGCLVAASDSWDDTELYAPLYPDYDWSCLARRVWGVSRAIDYLSTLPQVDKGRFVLTDHSRGGKMATWAAAFEERLAATIGSSPVTGGAIPWRYCTDKYANETIEMITRNYPTWFNPRLRFFIGRENKLPVDMHEMVALVAPRAYMVTLSMTEWEVNAWGEEKGHLATKRVYDFLGAGDRINLRFRPGTHRPEGSNVEEYFDWYDTMLGIKKFPPFNKLLYNYSFDRWLKLSGEKVDATKYPEVPSDALLKTAAGQPITTDQQWKAKRAELRQHIAWGLGDGPGRQAEGGPKELGSSPSAARPNGAMGYVDWIISRPEPTENIDRAALPFSDESHIVGQLYYRRNTPPGRKMPVVILLHPYSYSRGYSILPVVPETSGDAAYQKGTYGLGEQGYMGCDFKVRELVAQGFGVFVYDMIGFGSRIPEVERFYERYPHWSLMGKMVDDVRGAVDVLSDNEMVDSSRIFVMGYALGGTVALYSATMDDRIAGVVSVCGFTPLRTQASGNGFDFSTGYIDDAQVAFMLRNTKAYRDNAGLTAPQLTFSSESGAPRSTPDTLRMMSEVYGLIPRLGFFVGHEKRVPWDYDEVLALVAPRPMLIVAPRFDQDARFSDVEATVKKVRGVYELLSPQEKMAAAYDPDWSGIWRGGVQRQVNLRSFEFYAPYEFNSFTNSTQAVAYYWARTRMDPRPAASATQPGTGEPVPTRRLRRVPLPPQ